MTLVFLARMDTILSRVKDIAHTAEQSRQDVVRLKEKMNRLMKVQLAC